MINKKILVIVSVDWFFLLHMYAITKRLKEKFECDITILVPNTGEKERIISKGFNFINLPLDRKGVNLLKELKTLISIYKVYKQLKPDIVHNITIKPIIYSSVIAKIFKIPVVNTICGLGYSFVDKKSKIPLKMALIGYQKALSYKEAYNFFENKNDCELFINKGILSKHSNYKVVNGVGVNLEKYKPITKSSNSGKIIFTMASRMIWEKGVKEFVESAKTLYHEYREIVEFRLYGRIDKGNPSAVSQKYLEGIEIDGYLKWFGFKSDMFAVFQQSDIIVLPSFYREGCPMVLMEACAMGLPIITTDSVGCRECVEEGVNGYKVSIKSSKKLAIAMEKLILNENLREQFGQASRKLAEKKFDQNIIIEQYKDVFKEMLKS